MSKRAHAENGGERHVWILSVICLFDFCRMQIGGKLAREEELDSSAAAGVLHECVFCAGNAKYMSVSTKVLYV